MEHYFHFIAFRKLVKQYINKSGVSLDDYRLNNALEILFPFERKFSLYRSNSNYTFSVSLNEQIRYQLKDNIEKSFQKLFSLIFKNVKTINFLGIGTDGEKFLVDILSNIISINYAIDKAQKLNYYPEELKIVSLINKGNIESLEAKLIAEKAHYLSYIGDHWSSISILEKLKISKSSNVGWEREYELIGLSSTALGNTKKSEELYTKCIESKKISDINKIRILYALSMLYLRHHNETKHDLSKGEFCLNYAFNLLKDKTGDFFEFNKVFNRNGYALCLYKRDKIGEAVKLLKWGLSKLSKMKGDSVNLHSSVLLYNLCLCYKKQNRVELAIAQYKKLLKVDGKMFEYVAEFIKYLIETRKYKSAKIAINKALPEFIDYDVLYSQYGFIQNIEGRHNKAEKYYEKAHELNSFNFDNIRNLILIKFKQCQYEWIINFYYSFENKKIFQSNNDNNQIFGIIDYSIKKSTKKV